MKKRYKIPLAFISFLLLACVVFWVILTQTKFLENQVNRSLGALVKTSYSMEVKVGDITGSFWDYVVIQGLTIDYTKARGSRVQDGDHSLSEGELQAF